MTTEWLWGLIASFATLAFGLFLHTADTKRQISILKKQKKNDDAAINNLSQKNAELEIQLHVFTSGEREENQKRLIAQQQLVDRLNDEIIP